MFKVEINNKTVARFTQFHFALEFAILHITEDVVDIISNETGEVLYTKSKNNGIYVAKAIDYIY